MSFPSRALQVLAGGKALAAPDFNQAAPAIYGPEVTRRISQTGARRYMQAYKGSDAVDWVADALDVYLDAAASAEFHFQGSKGRMHAPDADADEAQYPGGAVPADLWALFQRPNPFMTWEDLIDLLLIDYKVVGNGYWLKYPGGIERPLAIYRLTPAWIEVIPSETKPIARYLYHVEGQAEPLEFAPEQVIHFRAPNPHSAQYGAGAIASGPMTYDQELALSETITGFFQRGTKLSGVLQTERSVPEPLLQKMRRQFKSMYSGSRNAYEIAVLERGMTFAPIQPTAAEAQFVQLTELGRERVFLNFGVDPILGTGSANARPGIIDEAQQRFDNKKMKPLLNRLSRKISQELTGPGWSVDFQFDFEYVMPEKDRLTLAAVFSALPGVRVKEVREYVKLPPLGDDRDEIVLNMPGIGVDAGGSPDGTLPGQEGGRPPSPNNMGGAAAPGAQAARPDARYRPTRGKLQKALESGSPEDLEAVLAEALPAPAPDVKAMGERVIQVLIRNRGLKKPQRLLALHDVEQATENWPAETKPLRGKIVGAVAEGLRRGYSIDQILDGHESESEKFPGVRRLLTEGRHAAA